ncbi:hypothetical protein J6590_068595 [Homalodisca vitripennis]|nr:hypothetical protein J6590_068595 [Homalodisca vitripennis]
MGRSKEPKKRCLRDFKTDAMRRETLLMVVCSKTFNKFIGDRYKHYVKEEILSDQDILKNTVKRIHPPGHVRYDQGSKDPKKRC